MRFIFLLPRTAVASDDDVRGDDRERPARASECAVAMAAYLPPDGGIAAGGCFVQLLDLIDGGAEAPTDSPAPDAEGEAVSAGQRQS